MRHVKIVRITHPKTPLRKHPHGPHQAPSNWHRHAEMDRAPSRERNVRHEPERAQYGGSYVMAPTLNSDGQVGLKITSIGNLSRSLSQRSRAIVEPVAADRFSAAAVAQMRTRSTSFLAPAAAWFLHNQPPVPRNCHSTQFAILLFSCAYVRFHLLSRCAGHR